MRTPHPTLPATAELATGARHGRERLYRALLALAALLVRVFSRTRVVTGEPALPDGPLIVVGNHVSLADAFILVTTIVRGGRRPRMLGTAGLFRAPLLGALLRHVRYIPVDRHGPDPASALAPAADALAGGACIGLYPEGHVTREAGLWPARGKTGVVRLALDSGAPIVPIAQWGTHRIIGPAGTRHRIAWALLRRRRVTVAVGEPIDVRAMLGAGCAADADAAALRAGADAIMAELTALVGQLRGQRPPAAPTAAEAA